MNRSPFMLWLAAVFAGLTALLIGAGAATSSVFVVFLALPLGITAAVMWLHGTGRLAARMRARAAADAHESRDGRRTAGAGPRDRGAATGPFAGDGGGPFTGDGGRFAGQRRRRRAGAGTGGRARGRTRGRERMTAREAARVLGVEPDADEAAIKGAYREKAKQLHPDVEGGDEAAFRRVNEAYERLS